LSETTDGADWNDEMESSSRRSSIELFLGEAAPYLLKPPHYSQEEPHEGKFSLK
jgi:hypothetical protein